MHTTSHSQNAVRTRLAGNQDARLVSENLVSETCEAHALSLPLGLLLRAVDRERIPGRPQDRCNGPTQIWETTGEAGCATPNRSQHREQVANAQLADGGEVRLAGFSESQLKSELGNLRLEFEGLRSGRPL